MSGSRNGAYAFVHFPNVAVTEYCKLRVWPHAFKRRVPPVKQLFLRSSVLREGCHQRLTL
jgi:hypothetical protein